MHALCGAKPRQGRRRCPGRVLGAVLAVHEAPLLLAEPSRTQPNQGHRSLQMDTNARSERGEAPTSALKALWCELQGQDSRKSLFAGRKWPRFSGSDSPRLPNQSELGVHHRKALSLKSPTMCWSGSWPFWSLWSWLDTAGPLCHVATNRRL